MPIGLLPCRAELRLFSTDSFVVYYRSDSFVKLFPSIYNIIANLSLQVLVLPTCLLQARNKTEVGIFLLESYCNNFATVYRLALLRSGNVHPYPRSNSSFRLCHWNLNCILSTNCIKLSLIAAYNSISNFDLIALSETYLNSSISTADISIKGFGPRVFRSDHPSNAKRGGVYILPREHGH